MQADNIFAAMAKRQQPPTASPSAPLPNQLRQPPKPTNQDKPRTAVSSSFVMTSMRSDKNQAGTSGAVVAPGVKYVHAPSSASHQPCTEKKTTGVASSFGIIPRTHRPASHNGEATPQTTSAQRNSFARNGPVGQYVRAPKYVLPSSPLSTESHPKPTPVVPKIKMISPSVVSPAQAGDHSHSTMTNDNNSQPSKRSSPGSVVPSDRVKKIRFTYNGMLEPSSSSPSSSSSSKPLPSSLSAAPSMPAPPPLSPLGSYAPYVEPHH
jgi:hypothetical protein